jgi:hypothetical protein
MPFGNISWTSGSPTPSSSLKKVVALRRHNHLFDAFVTDWFGIKSSMPAARQRSRSSLTGHLSTVQAKHKHRGIVKRAVSTKLVFRHQPVAWGRRPHPLSPASSRRWKYQTEIENVGRVMAVAIRLRE